MMNYSLGSSEEQSGANETMADIPQNRTLMIEQLTQGPALKPVVVHGLDNVRQVFNYFKPEVDVRFTDAEGAPKGETLKFTSLDDFAVSSITAQSTFLKDHQTREEEYLKIITQLRTNKNLQAALNNKSGRQSLLDAINSMIAELKTNN